MKELEPEALTARLAQLDPEQLSRLVNGLQQRIDRLRAKVERSSAPVAIIGLACRFPGAPDAEAFAALQAGAVNAVKSPPAERPEAEDFPPAGYIEDVDRFDAGFFGIRRSEAEAMDPQHRMLLELSWHALEDAGYASATRRPRSMGIFFGLSTSDYEVRFRGEAGLGVTPAVATGTSRSIAAGRVAHLLDSTGPAMVLDTACSSSLVAVHHAVAALRSGSCRVSLAGGANALIEGDLSRSFEQAGMLSPSYACRTFDADADGYVRGEGCGIVVLKLLDEALRDGDSIRAVIRGSAVNHDGRASAITAPNAASQTALIKAALADAGVDPSEVQVLECHGTGTALGDPIEVSALAEAYGMERKKPLLLGSIKSNIGHLEAAAGIAGLIRLVLAMEAGVLPPVLHQRRPNPRISWEKLPVRVAATSQPWPEAERRRAGVSSFGFSGTNAHLIVEEPPPPPEHEALANEGSLLDAVFPLSAPDRAGLERLAKVISDRLEAGEAAGKNDPWALARTFAIGRFHHRQRAAVPFGKAEELLAELRAISAGDRPFDGDLASRSALPPKIAFLFTGQGSQWRGMGSELYEADEAFRASVDYCTQRLDPLLGVSLAEVMFKPGPERQLENTALAQPALFVLEYALADWLGSRGVLPNLLFGHSLGEWVAACRAGVLSLDDALGAVAARGRLMGAQPRNGGMAAVFADEEVVAQLIDTVGGDLDIAAINAPEEVVVSGTRETIAAFCQAADARGVGSQPLRVSHAFHSRLMAPAAEAFADELKSVTFAPPQSELISTLTGSTQAAFDQADYWVRQIRAPVRFADSAAAALASGATIFVEVGPSPLLLGMARRVPGAEREGLSWVPTLRRGRPAGPALAAALAQLYTAGIDLRWDAVLPSGPLARAPLYPFADERYWIKRPMRSRAQDLASVGSQASVSRVREASSEPQFCAVTSEQEIRKVTAALLSRSLQMSPEQLEEERSFLESGVDSLALSEAVAAIEKRWSIRIPRGALFESLTSPPRLLNHVVDIAKRQESRGEAVQAAVPTPPPAAPPIHAAGPTGGEILATASAGPDDARVRAYLAGFARDFVARSRASRSQRETYGGVLADSRASAGFRRQTKRMLYPIVGVSGKGGRMRDADGNEYVDITMGFGVQLFGHHPPFVVEALRHQLEANGLYLGPQAPLAGEVAAAIGRITGNERVLFCNSGTEAVMTALRLARHVSGRSKVAMFAGSYHGHFDGTLGRSAVEGTLPSAGGVLPGMVADLVVLDYGDPEESLRSLQKLGPDLAAVIVEPVQSRNPGLQPRDFLRQLRELTRHLGAALIFDEVLLGFRVALGGAQAWAEISADIVTYGKIVGGGLPIGVVAGDARYLDAIDGGTWSFEGPGGPEVERTFFAGTFNKNPLTMAAAKAVLSHLEAAGPALQQELNERTKVFVERLESVLLEEGAPIRVSRFSSLFRFTGASDLFYHHLLCNGVYVWEGRTCFLSTAHSDADLDRVVEAVRASVRSLRDGGLLPSSGVPAAPHYRIPLTPGQEALWNLAAFSPETASAYNQSVTLTLEGKCDQAALQSALRVLVQRHDVLRTTFTADGVAQIVHAELAPDFAFLGLEERSEASVTQVLAGAAGEPFDLERGPLFRVRLARLGEERYRLMLIQPHILTDGWSMQLIALELGALYSAEVTGTRQILPRPAPWATYVAHALEASEKPAAREHWLNVFADPPPPLDLPLARPRPALQTYAGAICRLRLPTRLLAQAEERARQANVSLFTLTLVVFGRLLAKLTDQNDFAVAIFSAGQPELGERALAGYCTATLPLRLRDAGTAPANRQLVTVQSAVSAAREHRDYPFAHLVRALGLKRDPARSPLASVAFNLDRLDAEPHFEGLKVSLEANTHGSVRWDLIWNMQADSQGLSIEAHYNSDLFDAAQLERWLGDYAALLESLLDEEEEDEKPLTQPATVPSLAARMHAHALAAPELPAVRDEEGVIDYGGLDHSTKALAAQLRRAGVGQGDRVAFLLPRGLGPVVAMLAAGWLGAAFVPLDPEQPPAHHRRILADSKARALVVQPGWVGQVSGLSIIEWSRDQSAEEDVTGDAVPELIAPATDEVAYILYTSGSTGEPKGVKVSYEGVSVYTQAMLSRLSVQHRASFAMVTSFAADLGYTAVFGALWSGGTLHVAGAEMVRDPAALADFLDGSGVDYLKIVPRHFAALLHSPDAGRLLPRCALLFGGDVLPWQLVDRVRSLGRSCRIFNHYGPTETTVGAIMTEVSPALEARMRAETEKGVPIGQALEGYEVAILDADARPVEAGMTGEICISGPAVGLGYVQPDDNRDPEGRPRFTWNEKGQRCYRTGDLGVLTADGMVVFRGRADEMVKIRGHRVEPNGLAAVLRSHEDVRDAAVLVERSPEGEPRLIAAVVTSLDEASIMSWLAERLPAAMHPAQVLVCESLPLTANGKLDRAAVLAMLPAPAPHEAAKRPAPQTSALESGPIGILQRIWQEALGGEPIGPDDDFFTLGGDSIVAIQIVGKARAEGLRISPAQVFAEPTPRRLAAVAEPTETSVAGASEVRGLLPLTPIQSWFCDLRIERPSRWCLTALFEPSVAVSEGMLADALAKLVAHHDALRIRLVEGGQGQALEEPGDLPPPAVVLRDAAEADGQALAQAEDALCNALMETIDLSHGPLIAGGLLLRPGAKACVVIAVHHFAFDMVSWSILAEDLGRLLSGQALRPASTRWSWWVAAQPERARVVAAELPYWREVERRATDVHEAPAGREGETRSRLLSLDADLTSHLLEGCRAAYGLRRHEAVLAVVGYALREWLDSPRLVLDLESHGREPFDANVDLSRTIGWFTAHYPLVLDAEAADDLQAWLVSVKESLRAVANHGVGYGLLSAQNDSELSLRPQVAFNFVGELQQFGDEGLRLLRLGAGCERDPEAARPHRLSIESWLEQGALVLACRYGPSDPTEAVDRLLNRMRDVATGIAAHCATTDRTVYTPSDFSGLDFNQDELDALMGDLESL